MQRWTPVNLRGRDVLVVPGRAFLSEHPADIACFIDDALGHPEGPEGRAALARWLGVEDDKLDDAEVRAAAARLLLDRHWVAVEVGQVLGNGSNVAPKSDPEKPADPTIPPRRPDRPTTRSIRLSFVHPDGRPVDGLDVAAHGDSDPTRATTRDPRAGTENHAWRSSDRAGDRGAAHRRCGGQSCV